MNESTKKRNNYNTDVVKAISKNYGVSTRYVTMSLNGDRVSKTSETIKKEYKRLVKEVEEILNK